VHKSSSIFPLISPRAAAVIMMQMLPANDEQLLEILMAFEQAVYASAA
jgi:hypothetical protein